MSLLSIMRPAKDEAKKSSPAPSPAKPATMWHVCDIDRAPKIRAHGLLPRNQHQNNPVWSCDGILADRVYLYVSHRHAEEYGRHLVEKGLISTPVILSVRTASMDWDRLTMDHETLACRLYLCFANLASYLDEDTNAELAEFSRALDLESIPFGEGSPSVPVGENFHLLSDRTLHALRDVAAAGRLDRRVMYQGAIGPEVIFSASTVTPERFHDFC